MDKIHKFVINLKRRPDRLETFQKNCPFDDVEIVGAAQRHENEAESDNFLETFQDNSINIYNSYPLLCHSPLISNSDIR